MFFLCLISFKSLRGCVKFFYGFPGKYNLCKVCLSVSCIHGWDPHGGNSKETIFRTVYKILPWFNLSDCRKIERWLQAHTWTTIEPRWVGNSTLCVSLLILGNWCISAYLHLCISTYLHQIGYWDHTGRYINVNSEVLVCVVIIRWWSWSSIREYCFLHTGKGDMNDWHCFQEIKRHKRPALFLMHLHWCAQFFWKQWEQSDNTAFKGLKWHKRPPLNLMYLHWCCLPLLKAMVIIRRNWWITNKTDQAVKYDGG